MAKSLIPRTLLSAGPMESPNPRSEDAIQADSSKSDEVVRKVLQRSIKEQIRDRAYELYVQRGCRDGFELEDWLDAEFEMHANR